MNDSYYLIQLSRGHFQESLMVHGSITEWLAAHNAKPTKDDYRFVVRGWRCLITPVSKEAVEIAGRIIGKTYRVSQKEDCDGWEECL